MRPDEISPGDVIVLACGCMVKAISRYSIDWLIEIVFVDKHDVCVLFSSDGVGSMRRFRRNQFSNATVAVMATALDRIES